MPDDATHIRNPAKPKVKVTLCNQSGRELHIIDIKDKWPDLCSGCWTCLAQAEIITGKIPKP